MYRIELKILILIIFIIIYNNTLNNINNYTIEELKLSQVKVLLCKYNIENI